MDVVVLGDINVDLVFFVDEPPRPGGMSLARNFQEHHGGVGGNIASALARLGVKVGLIGAIGMDAFGEKALAALRERGVETSRISVIKGYHTGLMSISVDNRGERAIVGSRGANAVRRLADEDLEYISRSRHLHVSGYQMLNRDRGEGALRLLQHAKKLGLTVSIDMEGAAFLSQVEEKLGGLPTHVFANRWEAEGFTGAKNEGEMVRRLRRRLGSEAAVVKLGEGGCIVDWRNGTKLIPAFKVKVVDSTGAGDAFNAGFIYGILNGLSPEESAIIGNAMGAYKCSGFGARHHPTLKELFDRFPQVSSLIRR